MEPKDIAEQVADWMPYGTKVEQAEEFLRLAGVHNSCQDFLHERLVQSIGKYMGDFIASTRRREQQERLAALGVKPSGALPRVMSIRRKGAPTSMLWTDAAPAEFIEAVRVEQNVIDGRNRTNKIRMQLAMEISSDSGLMSLPTLGAVCLALEIDPDSLGLDDLAA